MIQRMSSGSSRVRNHTPTGKSAVAPRSRGRISAHCALPVTRAARGRAKGASMAQTRPTAPTGPTTTLANGTNTMAKPKPVKPRTSPPSRAAIISVANCATSAMPKRGRRSGIVMAVADGAVATSSSGGY
jgi:hypothetical protein